MTVYYLTTANAQQYFGAQAAVELFRDSGTGGIDATIFATLATAAESVILGILGKGFDYPITVATHGQPAVDLVTLLCLRALKYHAYYRRDLVTEQIANDYTECKKEAERIAKGGLALPGDPPPPRSSPEYPRPSSSNVESLTTKPSNRSWTRDQSGMA